jgi:hypothetical protein
LNAFCHRTFKRFSTAFAIVLMGFFLKSNVLFHWTHDFFSNAFAIKLMGFFLNTFAIKIVNFISVNILFFQLK